MTSDGATANAAVRITGRYLLVVEGSDDVHFFRALASEMGIQGLQCLPADGKHGFRAYLGALVKTPGFSDVQCMGIIHDADSDAAAESGRVRSALKAAGLSAPKGQASFVDGKPRVGVLTLPPSRKKGALEDLILESVASRPELDCVDAYFECLRGKGLKLPPNPVHLSKLRVHVYIGSQRAGVRLLGEAADAGYWPWSAPVFEPLKKFLVNLCGGTVETP